MYFLDMYEYSIEQFTLAILWVFQSDLKFL